jgi:hypothetical protein
MTFRDPHCLLCVTYNSIWYYIYPIHLQKVFILVNPSVNRTAFFPQILLAFFRFSFYIIACCIIGVLVAVNKKWWLYRVIRKSM